MTFLLLAVAAQAAAAAPGLAGMLAEGAITDAPVPVHMLESVMAGPFGKNVFPTSADSPAGGGSGHGDRSAQSEHGHLGDALIRGQRKPSGRLYPGVSGAGIPGSPLSLPRAYGNGQEPSGPAARDGQRER